MEKRNYSYRENNTLSYFHLDLWYCPFSSFWQYEKVNFPYLSRTFHITFSFSLFGCIPFWSSANVSYLFSYTNIKLSMGSRWNVGNWILGICGRWLHVRNNPQLSDHAFPWMILDTLTVHLFSFIVHLWYRLVRFFYTTSLFETCTYLLFVLFLLVIVLVVLLRFTDSLVSSNSSCIIYWWVKLRCNRGYKTLYNNWTL